MLMLGGFFFPKMEMKGTFVVMGIMDSDGLCQCSYCYCYVFSMGNRILNFFVLEATLLAMSEAY